ncbi:MAG: phosphatase PAP2 family protein [Actinobacteria bacterium]|nr:phosphatase PAP2 family protein [Actinomycetota bacterium]
MSGDVPFSPDHADATATGRSGGSPPAVSTPFLHPAVGAFDDRVDALAARLRGNRIADRAMYGLSQAANHSLLWHGINLLDAAVGGPTHRRRAVRRSIVLAVDQAVVNGPVKMRFHRARPGHVVEHPHDLRRPVTSSFPSGHASAGACAATQLSRDLGVAPLWWGLAAAVGWSRIHVGVHHASDVVGGAAIGAALARLGERAWASDRRSAAALHDGT